MKTIVVIALVLVGAAQNHSTTNDQLNGFAWVSMSPAQKTMYLDGVAAGIQQGIELALATCADCPTPPSLKSTVHDVDVFYRDPANRAWPIASAYVKTRRAR